MSQPGADGTRGAAAAAAAATPPAATRAAAATAAAAVAACGKVALEATSVDQDDEDGTTPFLQAARSGTTQAMIRLAQTVGTGALGDRDKNGMTCLHLAAERKDGSAGPVVRFLLDTFQGRPELPQVDVRDGQGFTPLHVACMQGDAEAVSALLRRGAFVGAVNDRGSTPLHWAASRGHAKIIKLLVGIYGADFAAHASNGSTPLHWAASKGRLAAIKVLLGIFCAQVDVKDDKGCTPCLMAALNGHLKAVELLVDRFESKITLCDRKRTGLLHAASEMGHAVLASALIDRYKMPVEDKDRKGLTPLARAAQRNQVEVFKLLVEKHGARLDTVTANQSGLLHVACEAGAFDIARLLLEDYGFEVDARNANGDTPTLLAAAHGSEDVLALLVEKHGASLEAADDKGVDALHMACERRQSGVASVLLESYGLAADKPDPSGATALHVAARAGDPELVELLTGPLGKADIALRDEEGNQALHVAAACGHLGVVKNLVENAGADLGARNRSDKSALDVAVGSVNTDVADYLRAVLPEKHREGHTCKRRRGFERAGRWMRLTRATGFLQDLALENVFLLPVSTLLEAGRFPSHYDANRKKLLVAASAISPQAQVLLVTHPWESPGNPDPSGKQFSALRRFLDGAKGRGGPGSREEEGGTADGEGEAGFGYVWLSFSCTSSNRMRPAFRTHINNVLTAWCLSDHALVIPETVSRSSEGFTYTDVEGLVERGWCCVELLCVLHLGVPTTIHVALEDALSEAVNRCSLAPSEEQGAGGASGSELELEFGVDADLLPPSSVFELISLPDAGAGGGKLSEASRSQENSSGAPAAAAAVPGLSGPHSQKYSHQEVSEEARGEMTTDQAVRIGSEGARLSVGRCLTLAVRSASKRLSTSPSAAGASRASSVEAECLVPDDNACDGGDGGGERGAGQQDDRQATEESEHIVNLVWSSTGEARLDGITRLVADILKSLDDEVARDTGEAAKSGCGVASNREENSGAKEREVPLDSHAGRLLARVLSLGLGKQDVEDDGDGDGGQAAAGPLIRELYERLGAFSSAHERMDALKTLLLAGCYFSGIRSSSMGDPSGSTPQVPTYASTGSKPSSPRFSPLATAAAAEARERRSFTGAGEKEKVRMASGRVSGGVSREKDRVRKSRSWSGMGKPEAAGRTAPVPSVAGSVPSCHVS